MSIEMNSNIVIAHRLSIVYRVDFIVVIANGSVLKLIILSLHYLIVSDYIIERKQYNTLQYIYIYMYII